MKDAVLDTNPGSPADRPVAGQPVTAPPPPPAAYASLGALFIAGSGVYIAVREARGSHKRRAKA